MSDASHTPEPEVIWQAALAEVRRSLPESACELWIEPLIAAASGPNSLTLLAPERVRVWVERRYRGMIEDSLARVCGERVNLILAPASSPDPGEDDRALATQPRHRAIAADPRHDFGRFIIGAGNRVAHAAALAVAEAPGDAYNPLFLHGPPGLGKTHLMGAIASYLTRMRPEMQVHMTTAERFTNEFVWSLRNEGPDRFKLRYRELDALLIDDVQVLEGKARTEEEFVHTFNTLFAAGKQIVLTSDRAPGALSRLEERLRDRFAWGLTVELEPPDLATRTAVLLRLAPASMASPTEARQGDVARELARRVPGNIRLLEGALTRVMAYSSVLDRDLDEELIEEAVGSSRANAEPGRDQTSLDGIIDAVALTSGVSREQILSGRRTAAVVAARQLAMYLAREMTELSLAQIARAFQRDHTTVLHAVRVVEGKRANSEHGQQLEQTIHKIHRSFPADGANRIQD